jgi:4-aminobutyrate aminotransferase-like enzyme
MQVSELTPVPTEPVDTRFRRISTPIPVPDSIPAIERLRTVEPRSMAGLPPVIWQRARGFQVEDPYGNRFIDLTSGAAAANAGHAHPRIIQAVKEQLDAELLFTYAFPSDVRSRLVERIAGLPPRELDKAIAFCSGTEANECALTLMRRHGLSISPDKIGILSFSGTFFGRTLGARFAGGAPGTIDAIRRDRVYQTQLPMPGSPESRGFHADLAEHGVDPAKTAGIIFESIASMTTTPYPQDYVDDLMAWAHTHSVLVAVDEIQVGWGRTGRLFAHEHYGITPDLIAMGKGVSSSLPVSVVKGRSHVLDLAPPGEMSSTHGGNPVCMAAALANLDVFEDEDLVRRSADLGERLAAWLRPIGDRHGGRHGGRIKRIDGRGLWQAIHFRDPESGEPATELGDQVAMECVRRGLMSFITGSGFYRIAPPLVIDAEALEEAVGVFGAVVDDLLA